MSPEIRDRSIAELLRELSQEIATLVRQEMQLARLEISETVKTAQKSAGLFGTGAVLGLGAFAALTTAIIAGLALALPTWLSALLVAVVYGVAALVLAMRGKKTLSDASAPLPQTTQTVKEDIAWAKSQAHSERT